MEKTTDRYRVSEKTALLLDSIRLIEQAHEKYLEYLSEEYGEQDSEVKVKSEKTFIEARQALDSLLQTELSESIVTRGGLTENKGEVL